MKRSALITCIAAAFAFLAGEAQAQGPGIYRPYSPLYRPTTSPYLHLLENNGTGFAFDYFRRVRPELEFRATHQRMRESIQDLNRRTERLGERIDEVAEDFTIGPTGHRTSFMNLGGYYGGGGAARGAGPGLTRRGR